MTDREKLIEVIYNMDICSWNWAGKIADHLLANGVTFQNWIPVSERLPEKYTEVIAFSPPYSDYLIGFVDVAEDEKSVTCFGDGVQLYNVTHWMPLPEPPKEEKSNG